MNHIPQVMAWEITRRCALKCRHCRGAAHDMEYAGEFSTAECFKTVEALVRVSRPLIILTGGEPLMREDIYAIAEYAAQNGCRVVLATCGHLLSPQTVGKLKTSGVMAVSVSLDAATPQAHDDFRGVPGAYEKTMDGIECLKAAGMPFQINTTVSTLNVDDLPRMLEIAMHMGASTMDFFFLVPAGRGSGMADLALAPPARDKALRWIAGQERSAPIRIKTTCVPQYHRFRLKDGQGHSLPPFLGCMGGRGFVFVSHTGELQPCGFLNLPCGNLREAGFDFSRLYENSEVFQDMRSLDPYQECPARTYAQTGELR